jgi:kynurenine formamidase
MVLREGMIGHPANGRTPVRLSGSLSHSMYQQLDRRSPYDNERLSFGNEQWLLNGNTGTHMDSVWHADPDSEFSAEKMPIECGFGPAIWLDCSFIMAPGAVIEPETLETAEREAGSSIQRGDIVLIYTGWSKNIDSDPDSYIDEHMGLSKTAGEFLRGRGAKTVGIDLATVETLAGGRTCPVHMNFLRPKSLGLNADDFIAIIENVVNINAIPQHRFTFVGLPLPFEGGSGSPIRAIAICEYEQT